MPARLPIQWHSIPRCLSAAATARPALVWPPVPPPAITTFTASGSCPRLSPPVGSGLVLQQSAEAAALHLQDVRLQDLTPSRVHAWVSPLTDLPPHLCPLPLE